MNLPSYLVVEEALKQVQSLLTTFGDDLTNSDRLSELFGDTFPTEKALSLLARLTDGNFSIFPTIEIIAEIEINNASGAYWATTNTIYLSQEFLNQNANNISAVSSVLLEEIGHFLDWHFNIQDAPGDEGFLFASLVQGNNLEEHELAQIQTEDDTATVLLEGQVVQLEQANFEDNPAFDLMGLTQLRNDPQFAGIDGSGFSVAVIDSGLDANHPLIQPNFTSFYDFTSNSDTITYIDDHSTHVAGIIGATDENIGVAPDVGLIGLQVFDPVNEVALDQDVEAALKWVLDNHEQYNITAVNLSLGSGFYTPDSDLSADILVDDVLRLEEAGITVVASAGNSYKNNEYPSLAYPSIYSTLAVGSVWQDGTTNDFTWDSGAQDFSTKEDSIVSHSQRLKADNFIFAPGALITSTVPGGGTESQGGTSMASPHVSGSVALMQEAALQFGGRLLSPDEVTEIIRSTADFVFDGDDEDDNVLNTEVSYPRINIYNAIVEIKNRFQEIVPLADGSFDDPTNNTINSNGVRDITANDSIFANLGEDNDLIVGDNDIDFYRFIPNTSGILDIKVSVNGEFSTDTVLRLFDANGNELAFNDDEDDLTFGSFLRQEVTANTEYFIGINGYSLNANNYNPLTGEGAEPGSTGDYTLSLNSNNSILGSTVYRFYNTNLGVHFYTASEEEKDFVLENLPQYKFEGASYSSVIEPNSEVDDFTGAKPVYRFYNNNTGVHLYTVSEAEKSFVLNELGEIYSLDGIAYYALENLTEESMPVYRFYNSSLDVHFYTPSTVEKDFILDELPQYNLEGIGFYVPQTLEI